ncbi:16S rRNA (cytosine(1402)-N(4))-methyltransferase RsmH [Nitriliruptor alkaliphilus]|uniref:16S rRNA (cytosine(1402)-N(4))-methyltransferase RsmH n=1 Tax=Nitriliruptor alkaliphilus TaxID=427918 RepID=UPI000697AE54|nr:16S rRNA (cytosine(1402)-N(4))-methyltransferase RsmH [Nitriliruptor alkaliphilus]
MSAAQRHHVPVLLDRIVALLGDAPEGPIVDATLGAAGHARAVLEARLARHGRASLVGLDRDPLALELAADHLADLTDRSNVDVHLVRTRFDGLAAALDRLGIEQVAGVLFDLGISSMHVDRAERGFSYRQDGPLDMRMDPDGPTTAADLVNDLPVDELARILRRLGEEPMADRIARAVVATRPHTSTTAFAAVVRDAIPAARRRTGGHPATRTFQALRMAVNGELDALEAVLPDALARLAPGGVCVALSYHSLEDRAVKRAFVDAARGCTCPPGFPVCACGRVPLVEHLVRRIERPSAAEIADNPRASAARMRAVRRLDTRTPFDPDPDREVPR